jgi:3-oxoacyl-[acyl-carrier-protein] synthase II
VLETLAHATKRGASILAEVIGYGNCSDAYRITDEREDGGGCIDAMKRALADARVAPDAIQYINAHGTGTQQNDRTELFSIKPIATTP